MDNYDDRFDEAVDDATHAVIAAFEKHLKLPEGEALSDLMVEINDALTGVMNPAIYTINNPQE